MLDTSKLTREEATLLQGALARYEQDIARGIYRMGQMNLPVQCAHWERRRGIVRECKPGWSNSRALWSDGRRA